MGDGVSRKEFEDYKSQQAKQQSEDQIMALWKGFVERKNKIASEQREASNKLALEFLNTQVFAQQALAGRLGNALLIASNEYTGILGLKDAQKFLTVDLLLNVFSIAIPGLQAVSKGIEKWGEAQSVVKNVVSNLGGSASDYYGLFQNYRDAADADDSSMAMAAGSNAVIRQEILKANKGVGLALMVREILIPLVIKMKYTEAQVKNAWLAAGLPVLSGAAVGAKLISADDLDLIAKVFLYDMLKNYTSLHVTYNLWDRGFMQNSNLGREWKGDVFALPEDGNEYGSFTGMSQATRDAIYNRFGTIDWGIKRAKHNRPSISSYREMAKFWGYKEITY